MSTASVTIPRSGAAAVLRDYAELVKARVTTLIVMTAWAGFYFGALQSGVSSVSWSLMHAMLGIGLVSGGTAALNEVLERDLDALMRRTSRRPLPSGRMGAIHASVVALTLIIGGSLYLAIATNVLTGILTFSTAVVYLAAYTPLKQVSPVCTFIGAFPGAMPPLLGWTAARGRVEWEALVLFAIVFFWQFPHFYSIAWLYRDDYRNARIRMLPVIDSDGKRTGREIVGYSLALIPASIAPSLLGLAGRVYMVGAVVLAIALLYFGVRLVRAPKPMSSSDAKLRARQLLQATVIHLPLLFALMMLNALS